MISASSNIPEYTTVTARLDGPRCWAPISDVPLLGAWISVDLSVMRVISGVVIQGQADADSWVTLYQVMYSEDGPDTDEWEYVLDGNQNAMVRLYAMD